MIINTGQRTDIPAFYSEWFANRLKAGFVCVRNPYNPNQVSRYRLDPSVVDVLVFCTKNPAPMFKYMDLLKDYGQYWFVTITPYGRDIEPNVPDKHKLLDDFKKLSEMLGPYRVVWRYDPVFISDRYTEEYHLSAFRQISSALKDYTNTVVISFLDLYPKVKRNFPEAKEVTKDQRIFLGKNMIEMATSCGMQLKTCAEGDELAKYGADCSGCMKISDYERAIGKKLDIPKVKGARAECACYLSCDIGAYNTCRHLCRYCYANAETKTVLAQSSLHNPNSPFLIGDYKGDDKIHDVPQKSWVDEQMTIIDTTL
jgi:DNA repair photolyase